MSDPRAWSPHLPAPQRVIWQQVASASPGYRELTRNQLEPSIPARFERLARLQPERCAVGDARTEYTYARLNAEANGLARAIRRRSRAEQEPVGLLLEKSCAWVAACLGVLKAARLYVPLDPTLPKTRLAFIVEDTKPDVIITDGAHAALARHLLSDDGLVIDLDELEPGLEPDDLGLSIPPEHLTWILYTSGSTGKPKGVVQNHRNVLHYVRNYANCFCLTPSDRCSLLFSPGVNGAAHDLFASILTGASVQLFDLRSQGVARLGDWLDHRAITVYSSVPTVFGHFLDSLSADRTLSTVRLVRLIGEPVFRHHVERFKRHFDRPCVLVNRLGSTETGSVLFYLINHDTVIDGHLVPMGHPVEGNDVSLLDEGGRDIPAKGVGEIVVKSAYLSPGYWNQPALTQAAFGGGADDGRTRLYRMGDLGYRDDRGAVLHAGRTDFQVKIRGHRIESGEVEAALVGLASVKDGVVMARQQPDGDPYLVAYVVPKQVPGPTASELRHQLSPQLPEVMIPSRFVLLEALPQAPNGKVDRQRLPDPPRVRPELDSALVGPRTSVEASLAAILANLLDYQEIGVHDDFLELGGDSLLAGRFVARVNETFQVELTLAAFLKAPTVAKMARVVTRHRNRVPGPVRPTESTESPT